MLDWMEFVLALAVFFISHSIPVRPGNKVRIQAVLGKSGFTIAYSVLSLAVLGWLLFASVRAPRITLWIVDPALAAWLAMGLVLAGFVLAALTLGRPNPFSFGGGEEGFDPQRPQLVGWIRHPLLWAILLWAVAHLIANGDLAHVILFGIFCLFALGGMKIIDRRKQRTMGAGKWQETLQTARASRSFGWLFTPSSLFRIVGAVIFFGLLLHFHPTLFGVSPIDMIR